MNEYKREIQSLAVQVHNSTEWRLKKTQTWKKDLKQMILNIFQTLNGNKEIKQYHIDFVEISNYSNLSIVVYVSWLECHKQTGKQILQTFNFMETW